MRLGYDLVGCGVRWRCVLYDEWDVCWDCWVVVMVVGDISIGANIW